MEPKTRKEKIDDARWGIVLVGLIVVAPKLSNDIVDAVVWIAIASWFLMREGVVSAAERIWQFVTRQ